MAEGAAQPDWASMTAKIMDDLENGEKYDMQAPPLPSRNDLKRLERRSHEVFGGLKPKPKKSQSSPSLSNDLSMSKLSATQRPNLQRYFSVSKRPPIYAGVDNDLGPGQYDTHMVGSMTWEKDHDVSHPAQKQLGNHKSPPLAAFGKPSAGGMGVSKLARAPGPGHYTKPDLWDPTWQHYPPLGTSFDRRQPEPQVSRFGVMAKGATS
mmetsp:Transcript_81547/g.144004  ORF Transcript_81547/g.144004 Transcript_81547/m.144004 type:complete len:208 (-) Transcript_81547:93-716(-)